MTDHEELIHLDGLAELAERAGNSHAVGADVDGGQLNYERFGVCTSDLLYVAANYSRKTMLETAAEGGGLASAMVLQFLAGFDIGYQARIEIETRELLNRKDSE